MKREQLSDIIGNLDDRQIAEAYQFDPAQGVRIPEFRLKNDSRPQPRHKPALPGNPEFFRKLRMNPCDYMHFFRLHELSSVSSDESVFDLPKFDPFLCLLYSTTGSGIAQDLKLRQEREEFQISDKPLQF